MSSEAKNAPTANIPAEARIRVAWDYITEVDEAFSGSQNASYGDVLDLREKIEQASQHLSDARAQNADAKIKLPKDAGEVSLPFAASVALQTDARLSIRAAQLAPEWRSGTEHLERAKRSIENAIGYYKLAAYYLTASKAAELLGDKEGAIRNAQLALQFDPSDVDTIRRNDELRKKATFDPLWVPTKEPGVKLFKRFPWVSVLLLAALVLVIVASAAGREHPHFVEFSVLGFGFCLLAAGLVVWLRPPYVPPEQIPGTYEFYKAERNLREAAALVEESYEDRYRREQAR